MNDSSADFSKLQSRTFELAVRLAALFVLLYWCFILIEPFLLIVLWGIIVAIALLPVFQRLSLLLGGRSKLAASILVVLLIALLVIPAVMLTDSLIISAQALAKSDGFKLMTPPASVAQWPLVGERVFDIWQRGATNLPDVFDDFEPQIRMIGSWLLETVTNTGLGILKLLLSFVIAGVLMANSSKAVVAAQMLAARLVGSRGPEFTQLCSLTIGNVALGIVGVSILQASFLGFGFLLIDLPGAGLLALLALVLCIVQVGAGLVSIPTIIYVFSTSDLAPAIIFAIWTMLITLSDSVLKPMVFGRGAAVPGLVIFLGAIGGLLSYGIIGLFVGAVVLSLGYSFYGAWLAETHQLPSPKED
ncbi:MAG: AI-2E family transporter [Chromatiales bacterium]|jgi:predicted PurR-regulated permease PerM|nr:AI-2E family transporter [Chromatiales bacterium]